LDTSAESVELQILYATAYLETHLAVGRYSRDSQMANLGMGSWTRNRIGQLLQRYETAVNAAGLQERFYSHFDSQPGAGDGQSRFRTLRDTWLNPRTPRATAIDPADLAAIAAAARDEYTAGARGVSPGQASLRATLREAELQQMRTDFSQYILALRRLTPPYPYLDAQGRIREYALAVLVSATHQTGSLRVAYEQTLRRFGGTPPPTEAEFLQGVAEVVVSRTNANRQHHINQERVDAAREHRAPRPDPPDLTAGARNRYLSLGRMFQDSDRWYPTRP
jgi:hypothetical protein